MPLRARLGLLFGLQFAIPGAWVPGLWPWLSVALGLDGSQIGLAFLLGSLGSFAAPFYAGQLADRVMRADRLLGCCYLGLGALLLGLSGAETAAEVYLWMGAIGFFWAPTVGLTQAVCLSHIPDRHGLGPLRAWGTAGFVLSGIAVGHWLMWKHTPGGVSVDTVRTAQDLGRVDGLFLGAAIAFVQASFCLLALPRTPPSQSSTSFAPAEALGQFSRQPLRTLAGAALILASVDRIYMIHGAGYLSRWGWGEPGAMERVLGVGGTGLMGLGQLIEVALLFSFPFIARRIPVRGMLLIASMAFVLRMAIFSWCDQLPIILVGVGLHGVCFALFFFAGSLVVDEVCPVGVRASGQTLFQLIFGGLGGAIGGLLAGAVGSWALVDGVPDPGRLFLVPLALSAVATAWIAWRYPRSGVG